MDLNQLLDVENVSKCLHKWNNTYINRVLFKDLSDKEKVLLGNNAKYKSRYKGKRCFIIGNAPSVNQIDFSLLNQELVLTVNEMFRHKNFSSLNSDFHFLADPAYLKLNKMNKGDEEIIDKMGLLAKNNTVLFFPLSGAGIAKRYGWQKKLDIHYFASKLYFYDGYKEKIDFTRYIPSFQAVIQWCIAFSVYMECSEIYLLGCDATNIATDISLFIKKDADLAYAYDLSKETADLVRRKHRQLGLENTLWGYWRIVHLFSELYNYCKRNNVKLYNCSKESILDSIPKRDIYDVLG